VLVKRLRGCCLEVGRAGAGGVELAQQRLGLAAHGFFHERELPHLAGWRGSRQTGEWRNCNTFRL